jgi:hypothetical protein
VNDGSSDIDGGRDALARRVAAGLALLEAGRVGDARRELEDLLATLRSGAPPVAGPDDEPIELGDALADGELERAFDEATPERAAMVDADQIAQDAMREADLDLPEGVLPITESPFATRTVADLLERQGHTDAAERIRSRLSQRGERGEVGGASAPYAEPEASPGAAQRARVIANLERWLGNLQRGVA